jgi:hypothetical protein
MVDPDMRSQVRNSFKDNYFTVFGFTAAYGRAVMCAIIIAASKIQVTNVCIFNPLSKDREDLSNEDMQGFENKLKK